jgi:hypothetical protein
MKLFIYEETRHVMMNLIRVFCRLMCNRTNGILRQFKSVFLLHGRGKECDLSDVLC